MNTDRWIALYLDATRAELDSADNTILAYGRDLADFAAFLMRRNASFATADRSMIENYLIALDQSGMAQATRARRLSAIRQLYRFAYEEGWRSDNPAAQIKGPRKVKNLPKTLSEQDVTQMLQAAQKTGRTKAENFRNACLFQLLYATGMRVSELVSLPVAAARGNPQMLLVKGKGGKERMVPLSPPARTALEQWLQARDDTEEKSRVEGRGDITVFVPQPRESRSYDPRVVLHVGERRRCRRRSFADRDHTSHNAPRVCDASAGQWCRFAGYSDLTGSRRYFDDRNLYACSG